MRVKNEQEGKDACQSLLLEYLAGISRAGKKHTLSNRVQKLSNVLQCAQRLHLNISLSTGARKIC
jgi:hypothetical protein